MFNPLKSYRHPALREFALAKVVYDHLAILDAKVQNILELARSFKEKVATDWNF